MKKAVGSVPTYTIIEAFIVILFAFLAAIMSYYKAFKLNNRVTSIVESCEGKFTCYQSEVVRLLNNYTYKANNVTCPKKDGVKAEREFSGICIYRFDNDGSTDRFSYGVITFMTWDFPIINQVIKLPIFSKTDRMYKF